MSDDTHMTSTEPLVLKRMFDAPPERVFAAWADPALLAQWWGPPGSRVIVIELDIRVGGRYRFHIEQPDAGTHLLSGIYQVVQPPSKLVFTWQWENPEMDIGNSLVTLEFHAHGMKTELRLTHAQLPSDIARTAHAAGWVGILDKLDTFLQHITAVDSPIL
jgi:uncharacterized protein YndB with AHSA1/START domain